MSILVVVNNPNDWPLHLGPGATVVDARGYLLDQDFATLRGVRVFNLCRSYSYQSLGYYVSLLASARGHSVLPDLTTIHDLQSLAVIKAQIDELDQEIQRACKPLKSETFEMHAYFGNCPSKRYNTLARRLFALYPVPFLRINFAKRDNEWTLAKIGILAVGDLPEEHRPWIIEAANSFFNKRNPGTTRKRKQYRYDLAILHDPHEKSSPSNTEALDRFCDAARELKIRPELITNEDLGDLATYDALFIRATTAVNHYTYRFAQRADAEGLVVIDDPTSILRCTNKVYLKELLERFRIRTPRSIIAHKRNIQAVAAVLGFPCVIKQPDSGFSIGVTKVADHQELERTVTDLLKRSDLLLAQEYLPTDFDWRIGILDRKPIFACRYGMAAGHWQIIHRDGEGKTTNGWHEAVPLDDVPNGVVNTALRAANTIGDGLYGVDCKTKNGTTYVIEVNDNPNIDHGVEDGVLGDELYRKIMRVFLARIERNRGESQS